MSNKPVYDPEILTPALAAQWVSDEGPGITADMAMDDIIQGRTVVISAARLTELEAELEKHRGGMHTHGPDCWSWGWRHYECAEREIARLRARVAELEAGEPVAWLYRAVDDGTTFASTTKPEKEDAYYTHQPLYTAPPQPEGWRPIETAPKEQWVIVYGERTASCPAYVTFAWLTPQGEWRDWYWESMESRPPDLWSACPDRALAGGGT